MLKKNTLPTFVIHLAFLIACLGVLSACVNTAQHPQPTWHDRLPPKQYFINKYESLPDEKKTSDVNDHLNWVKRFYIGSSLYTNGWLDVSQLIKDSISDLDEKNQMESRMALLGKTIATEWALDNHVRKINTQNMITWGNALLKSIELGDQTHLISLIEKDVAFLINEKLESKQINSERYYATEDYDNF